MVHKDRLTMKDIESMMASHGTSCNEGRILSANAAGAGVEGSDIGIIVTEGRNRNEPNMRVRDVENMMENKVGSAAEMEIYGANTSG